MPNNTADFRSEVTDWIKARMGEAAGASAASRFFDAYDMLKSGIAHFWFTKKDGSVRSAYGTLDMGIVQRHGGTPKDKSGPKAFNGTVAYYDLEKDAWRCFYVDSVKEVDFEYGS